MNSPFFFLSPLLKGFNEGTAFRKIMNVVYLIFAIASWIPVIYILWLGYKNKVYDARLRDLASFLMIFSALLAIGWVAFQVWMIRRKELMDLPLESRAFTASPVFAHLLQTSGEVVGLGYIIISMTYAIASLFVFSGYSPLRQALGQFLSTSYSYASLIIIPITGFMIILFSRFLAEQIRALAAIANNTER